ncbi:MAG: F0F1 ATP synthase subunit B [Pseudomonadota bacterium]
MRYVLPIAALTATPAMAAGGGLSLYNTDFVVLLGLLIFIGILVWAKVPALLMGMLDKRAEGIRNDLDEAKALREEAQSVLASFERKTKEAADQADEIIAAAKAEAEAAAAQAKVDLEASVTRRLAAAEDQIDSARAAAVKEVRDQAIAVATAAAGNVVAAQMSAADANKLIDGSIETVAAKLH